MIIVILNHNFQQDRKVFDFLCDAEAWADKNGYTLVRSDVPHIYYATF